MVQLMDYAYYKKYVSQKSLLPADIVFNELTLQNLINLNGTKEIIAKIDGGSATTVNAKGELQFISKFTGGEISTELLSTGCKTALNILYLSSLNPLNYGGGKATKFFLNITECGPNALLECFDILDKTKTVVGVLSTYIVLTNRSCKLPYTIRFQYGNEQVLETNDWMDIVDIMEED